MRFGAIIVAGALAAALSLPAAVQAAEIGFAASDVNLRKGPGTAHAKIAVVPAGAQITVFFCASWCRVRFAGIDGWVNANYVASGAYPGGPPGHVVITNRPPIPPAPAWGYYQDPWWDEEYDTWYDGHYWWWNNGWHRRPPGVSIWLGFGN